MGNEMGESRITVEPAATRVASTTRGVNEAIRSMTGVGKEGC